MVQCLKPKIFLTGLAFLRSNCRILTNMISETLMTIEDLARYLKVKKRTIYEWLKAKKIPASKVIGQWRFRKDRIDKWLRLDE